MDPVAKQELALAYIKAIDLYSESYKKNGFVMAKTWAYCCHEATNDQDLEELIYCMYASGGGGFTEWAHKILGISEPAESPRQDNDQTSHQPK